ncbi:hypothetical protein OROHE_005489 [Orobanche hederae]
MAASSNQELGFQFAGCLRFDPERVRFGGGLATGSELFDSVAVFA